MSIGGHKFMYPPWIIWSHNKGGLKLFNYLFIWHHTIRGEYISMCPPAACDQFRTIIVIQTNYLIHTNKISTYIIEYKNIIYIKLEIKIVTSTLHRKEETRTRNETSNEKLSISVEAHHFGWFRVWAMAMVPLWMV